MNILSLGRPCPKCQADAAEPCKSEAGIAIDEVHSERWPAKSKSLRADVLQAAAKSAKEANVRT
jgi:hypothetical protein